MIVEALIAGASLIGCAFSWVTVQKHRTVATMQKQKLDHELEVLRPAPEPRPEPKMPSPMQQSLTELLARRRTLETHITSLRAHAADFRYSSNDSVKFRADCLKALEDARDEQKELVLEELGLLEMMHGVAATHKKDQGLAPSHPDGEWLKPGRAEALGHDDDEELYSETDADEVRR